MKSYKLHKDKIIAWLLFLIWLGVIFSFSNQTGSDSGNLSNGLLNFLINLIHLPINAQTISFLFRKLAHFTEYFILGFLTINLFKKYINNIKKVIIFTVLFGLCYASSDEFHQMFIVARSPQVIDVCIDTSGVICSTLIYFLVKKVLRKK